MSKFVYPGLFTFCPRVVDSIAAAYGADVPDEYEPIKFPDLATAMAMFWRVKSWQIDLTRTSTPAFPLPAPAPEAYSIVAELSTTGIETEANLVCNPGITWAFDTTTEFGDGSTVNCFGDISFSRFQLFFFDKFFYLQLGITINIGEHHYADYSLADGTSFHTEWYNTGASVIVAADAKFSLFNLEAPLIAMTETENIVSALKCVISPKEFWPYANEDGSDPTYNTSTGERLA